ncbi:unnamed protein product [Ceratitis capitata]|uniref:(Mediterranean fruit fly) hypothetical protein n=1 Tax=Ceratitis capitata TaxID=7213 RepID=A0A811U6Q7_CERCA|nr:unnamed protein product [Ceratitis capitata]
MQPPPTVPHCCYCPHIRTLETAAAVAAAAATAERATYSSAKYIIIIISSIVDVVIVASFLPDSIYNLIALNSNENDKSKREANKRGHD